MTDPTRNSKQLQAKGQSAYGRDRPGLARSPGDVALGTWLSATPKRDSTVTTNAGADSVCRGSPTLARDREATPRSPAETRPPRRPRRPSGCVGVVAVRGYRHGLLDHARWRAPRTARCHMRHPPGGLPSTAVVLDMDGVIAPIGGGTVWGDNTTTGDPETGVPLSPAMCAALEHVGRRDHVGCYWLTDWTQEMRHDVNYCRAVMGRGRRLDRRSRPGTGVGW